MGLGDRLVGVTTYCQRPADAQKKEKVGTIKEVNIERVLQLKPDAVLATTLTDPKAKEKLKNLGIDVVEFSYAKNFDEVCDEFLKLARLLKKEEEGGQIVRKARMDLEDIKKGVEKFPRPKVFVQIGARPLFAATKDSFINDFIEFAGGINIAGISKSGLYSREMVLKENPDIILIATMGIVGEEEKNAWLRYKTLNAARQNRIYIIDPYKVCSANPVSFIETLKEIAQILRPGYDTEKDN